MSAMEIFKYRNAIVRGVVIDTKAWVVALDICGGLELTNPAMALSRIDGADKRLLRRSEDISSTYALWETFAPQVQQVWLVSEDGATDLVLESRKPEARVFRRFLTHEVWPAIRDTGAYILESREQDPLDAIEAANRRSEAANQRSQLAVNMARQEREARRTAERQRAVLQAVVSGQAPMVAKANAHSVHGEAIHRQAFAREVQKWGLERGISILLEQVYEMLRRKGMLISGNRSDRNQATAHAEKSKWATNRKGTAEDTGHAYSTTYIYPRGQDVAWKWITSFVEANGTLQLPRQIGA